MDLYDLTYLLAIIAAVVSLIAQGRVTSAYNKFKSITAKKGITGAEAAHKLLENADVFNLDIEETQGVLTDHYDPSTETLRLSHEVFHGKSLSAIGIAAHEAGHAIQHREGYPPLTARQSFVRVANIGSRISVPAVLIGILLISLDIGGGLGSFIIDAGLLMFTAVVALSLITLPVEFNASGRAVAMLESQEILDSEELEHVRKVLSAAAWTYIAATISSILTLLRLVMMSQGRRRR